MPETVTVSKFSGNNNSTLMIRGALEHDGTPCNNLGVGFSARGARVSLGGGVCTTGAVALGEGSQMVFAAGAEASAAVNLVRSARTHDTTYDTPVGPTSLNLNELGRLADGLRKKDPHDFSIRDTGALVHDNPKLANISPALKAITEVSDALPKLPPKLGDAVGNVTFSDVNKAAEGIKQFIDTGKARLPQLNDELKAHGKPAVDLTGAQAALNKAEKKIEHFQKDYDNLPTPREVADAKRTIDRIREYDPKLSASGYLGAGLLTPRVNVAATVETKVSVDGGNVIYSRDEGRIYPAYAKTNTVHVEAGVNLTPGSQSLSEGTSNKLGLNPKGDGVHAFVEQSRTSWHNVDGASRRGHTIGLGGNTEILGGVVSMDVTHERFKQLSPGSTPTSGSNNGVSVTYTKKF